MTARTAKRIVWLLRSIAAGLFLIMLVIWILCQGDYVIWSQPADVRITVQHGSVEWLSRHRYFRYTPDGEFCASIVLVIVAWGYRYLRTPIGLGILTIVANYFVFHAWNYPAYFLIVVLDWGIAILCLRWVSEPKVRDPNLCIKCGYDLRATPERCPECGTAVALETR